MRGFDYQRELAEQSAEDYKFGAITEAKPCITNIALSVRGFYLPVGEVQKGKEDFVDCATRAVNNILETKFNWLLRNEKLKNEAWLKEKGYIVNDYIEFSDRFVAINSGTTRQGNSLKAPIDAIRKQGLIPKAMLPANSDMRWADYHNANDITDEMRKLGEEFANLYPIEYDYVEYNDIAKALEKNCIDTAGYAWPLPINGIYPKTDLPFTHAFMVWKPQYFVFDNYRDSDSIADGEWIKQLAPDYPMYRGYRINITAEYTPEIAAKQIDLMKQIIDKCNEAISLMQKLLKKLCGLNS